jgi:hypothetical protein
VFTGRAVRFGAYGDPVHIPIGIVQAIVAVASKHTGYTHQWKQARYQPYREFVMASVDNPQEYASAFNMGWRTFRVRSGSEPLADREIMCPAADETGHKTSCERCGLCNGSRGVLDARKNIAIIVHGAGRNSSVAGVTIDAQVCTSYLGVSVFARYGVLQAPSYEPLSCAWYPMVWRPPRLL